MTRCFSQHYSWDYCIKVIKFTKLQSWQWSIIDYILSPLFHVISLLNCDDRPCDLPLWSIALFVFSLSFQITINTTNAQPLGQQLVAFTSRAAHFTDVMDVIFVTHLVERLTRLVEKRRDVRVNTYGAASLRHNMRDNSTLQHPQWATLPPPFALSALLIQLKGNCCTHTTHIVIILFMHVNSISWFAVAL